MTLTKWFSAFIFSICSLTIYAADLEKLSKQRWIQLTSNNFKMITDLDEKKARILLNELEDYNYFQRTMIGVEPRPNLKPLPILAINKSSSFKHIGLPKLVQGVFKFDYERDYYSAIANLAGYRGNKKNPGIGHHFFMHEYNHFLSKFSLKSRPLPVWYEEGKAEYLATFKFDGEKIYLGDSLAIQNRASDLYINGTLQNIKSEKIMTAKKLPESNNQILDFYARSFFIVHYINSSIELRKSLAVYLNAVNSNVNEADALKSAFGQTFEELDASIKNYMLKSMMMRVISVKEGKIEFPKPDISVVEMTPESFKAEASYFFPEL